MTSLRSRYNQTINDSMKLALLLGMLPRDYQDLVMQSAMIRENSMLYEEARDHIIKLTTQKLNMAKPVPMDISGMEKGGDGQPWAGGGDGGDQGQGQWDVDAVRNPSGIKCYACGKYGHYGEGLCLG